jgi:hypothetical protein
MSPRLEFPARHRPSVRRLMFLDYDWIDAVDVHVVGEARDEVTDVHGATRVVGEAAVDVETREGLVSSLTIDPAEFDVSPLVGQLLRQGFRARVRPLHDAGGRPLGLLLDDLPGAMIAAGYVTAMERQIGPGTSDADEMPRGFHQADLCSGWRSDGTMMVAVRAGNFLPFEPLAAVAEHVSGSDGWPARPIPVPGLRRHRRMDVTADDGRWHVDAWFRDTYRGSDGACGALHEYTVELDVDAETQTILAVEAIPHALPWAECPAAADAAVKLIGSELAGLRSSVPKVLQGIESCTHLTNELRELADVPHLVELLSSVERPRRT